jgi:predicted regulator of Ras-like GTPase activity (Roadblock/LC7/MglB family)
LLTREQTTAASEPRSRAASRDQKAEAVADAQPQVEQGRALPAQTSKPAEVLATALKLEGVAGALIALSDGFKVASKLPPGLDGDVVAAFLPHIFSKVNQSARELRMGDLNNLNFTVDNVPWKIFRVNQIFFAALGHAGKPMPTDQLAALAHKLTFKN